MAIDPEIKTKLKSTRDRVAAAAPRAKLRADLPAELHVRLARILGELSRLYLAVVRPDAADDFADAIDDALGEANLALFELERSQPTSASGHRPAATVDRRRHERLDLDVEVRLLSHATRQDPMGGSSLASETTIRRARNVSLSGIFVALGPVKLPLVQVGSVVRMTVNPGAANAFQVRGVVMRRTPDGIGLSWMDDAAHPTRAIAALLDSLRERAQHG